MSYLINNQQKVNDIVFANRNKAYGAYAIRSSYGLTILKSIGIMLLGFSTVVSILWYFSNHKDIISIIDDPLPWDTTLVIFNPPTDPPKPPADDGGDHRTASVESAISTSITDADTLTPELPASETVAIANTSAITSGTMEGGESGTGTGTPGLIAGSNGTATETFSAPVDPYQVDSMPEFPGGFDALKSFIAKNLRYPEPARELGEQGTVYIKFVVSEKGFVENINVEKRAGYGMDEEATRVVSIVPRFKKPAKVKGHAVKMYYHLPIRFIMKN